MSTTNEKLLCKDSQFSNSRHVGAEVPVEKLSTIYQRLDQDMWALDGCAGTRMVDAIQLEVKLWI